MTTKDFQKKSPLMIFLSYFKNHKKLFAIDVSCAVGIAAIDLAFPLITRSALYDMLPNQLYRILFSLERGLGIALQARQEKKALI